MDKKQISLELPATAAAPNTIAVKSSAFANGSRIPDRHTAYYDGISPALAWSGVPAVAKSIVVIMEDPDAPKPKPFIHWLIMNLPPTATTLPENVPNGENIAGYPTAQQGANGAGRQGYYGMLPPPGHGIHHYHFQIFALDTPRIDLLADYAHEELLAAMSNHVIAKGELVGTYERPAANN